VVKTPAGSATIFGKTVTRIGQVKRRERVIDPEAGPPVKKTEKTFSPFHEGGGVRDQGDCNTK